MKLWVVLVAATLLAGCGAEAPTPPPPARGGVWGFLVGLGATAQNVTARLGEGPLLRRLRWLVTELKVQATALSSGLRAEASEARERAAEYGAEAKAAWDQSWGEVKNRGASYLRKFRKRLNRDGEELKRRLETYGQAWGETMVALRRGWEGEEEEGGDSQPSQEVEG